MVRMWIRCGTDVVPMCVSRTGKDTPGSRPKYSSMGAAMVMSHISLERY